MCLLVIYHCEICYLLFNNKDDPERPQVVMCNLEEECKGHKSVAQGIPGPCGRGECKKEAEKLGRGHKPDDGDDD